MAPIPDTAQTARDASNIPQMDIGNELAPDIVGDQTGAGGLWVETLERQPCWPLFVEVGGQALGVTGPTIWAVSKGPQSQFLYCSLAPPRAYHLGYWSPEKALKTLLFGDWGG